MILGSYECDNISAAVVSFNRQFARRKWLMCPHKHAGSWCTQESLIIMTPNYDLKWWCKSYLLCLACYESTLCAMNVLTINVGWGGMIHILSIFDFNNFSEIWKWMHSGYHWLIANWKLTWMNDFNPLHIAFFKTWIYLQSLDSEIVMESWQCPAATFHASYSPVYAYVSGQWPI